MKTLTNFIAGIFYALFPMISQPVHGQPEAVTYAEYIRNAAASEEEIDVFLNKPSWARFDPDVGYILGNYAPHDGVDGSKTISTARTDGARTSFVYTHRPCRINTYGNSFTQCHQVSDAETWQEYLAGHLGEPIRNYGMGGFGVYQAYRRMLREEKTDHAAEYIILYIWGDDHIRTLLRCRYALISGWNKAQEKKEGVGIMFHGNFWCNIEMNMETGLLEEHESRIRIPEKLYQMTDPEWMYENLIDDLALQMYLFKLGHIRDIDMEQMNKLAGFLGAGFNQEAEDLHAEVGKLLDRYAYAATLYILGKARTFASVNNKKLMVLLFDPYGAMRQLLNGEPRTDQEIVDFLEENGFNYFDMNLVHVEDYQNFKPGIEDYYNRYFIGHYNPRGNHFFAYSLKPRLVEWLDPKPFTYQLGDNPSIDFNGYLEGLDDAR
jgi:hypothetical protein